MKLQIMSDLHLEMHKDKGKSFIESLDPSGVDVLILAGDITSGLYYENLYNTFKPLTDKYRHVIYTPGNHEFYGGSPKEVNHQLKRLHETFDNLYVFIEPCQLLLRIGNDVVKFLGGTMWFEEMPANNIFRHYMNDFAAIEDFEPWVYEQNIAFKALVRTKARCSDVVISHHLPSEQSIAKQYKGSGLNAFFMCDMSKEILEDKPKLWIHGHTHTPCDYTLGETRVVANPLGYPGESKNAFIEKLIVEV